MEIMLGNFLQSVADTIQAQEKMPRKPFILGVRVIDGPWDNTKFLDVETKENTYSGLLIKENGLLKMVSPFKVTKKDVKK